MSTATATQDALAFHDTFPYRNLLTDLLYALSGYCGDVFVNSLESLAQVSDLLLPQSEGSREFTVMGPDECYVQLSPDITCVDSNQRELLNSIVKLGFHYMEIKRFIQSHQYSPSGNAYCNALCSALSELLDVYLALVVRLEREVLAKQAPSLQALQIRLAQVQVLLPALHSLVYELRPHVLPRFGQVALAALQQLCSSGDPLSQQAFQWCMHRCTQVMFKQISHWMVHGILNDPAEEFFIVRQTEQNRDAAAAAPGQHQQQQQQQQQQQGEDNGGDSSAYHEWHHGFMVNDKTLPHLITRGQADTILFIGKAVRLLRSPQGALRGAQLLPPSEALQMKALLEGLQAKVVFDSMAFTKVLEVVRAKVAGRLWELVVRRAELRAHLASLKDYFLLARGDFWDCFLVDAQRLLALPPVKVIADVDIKQPFQSAGSKTSAAADPFFANFMARWFSQPQQIVNASAKRTLEAPAFEVGWDNIALQVEVQWPLGLLLTPAALQRYNLMFQYLLRLKRVQVRLQGAWQVLQKVPEGSCPADMLQQLQQLRHRMAWVVSNLQIYLQQDVIEASWEELQRHISEAHDYSQLERAHSNFLSRLLAQSLLIIQTMCAHMSTIFASITELCALARAATEPDADEAKQQKQLREQRQRLQQVAAKFEEGMSAFRTSLTSQKLHETNKAPHLKQLQLRLYFNDFHGGSERQSVKGAQGSVGGRLGQG